MEIKLQLKDLGIENFFKSNRRFVIFDNNIAVAEMCGDGTHISELANLFINSPELLEICKAIVDLQEGRGNLNRVMIEGWIRQVISKIEKRGEETANAALIAAAPELLEALKKLEARVDWFLSEDFGKALGINYNPLSEEFFELEQARAAIAKAEGKS